MSERRESRGSPSAEADGGREDSHQDFVGSHYSSPEAGGPDLQDNDYNTIAGYFDEEEEDEDETDSGSESAIGRPSESPSSEDSSSAETDYSDPVSAHSPGHEQLAAEDNDDPDRLEAATTSPEYIYVGTQYTPTMGQGGEDDPIVIGDTQYTPFGGPREEGPIVIGDTQMPDSSSAIEVTTSPASCPIHGRMLSPLLDFPLPSPELVMSPPSQGRGVGESSARGQPRKHRMSSVDGDGPSECGAADSKKQRGEDGYDKDDTSKTIPPPPPPQPPIRTRTQFKCAVCLDTPDPAVYVHPCGHVFCEGCAQGAVQTTGKCPVCRHAMRARSIRVLQFRVAPIGRTSK
ncbi:hypothetical protein IWW47_000470 [Coemansia sp. RSA 2052]|nr:hypothetical protein IWW47_000470 [Coemansia sp. RSA 2052]